MAKPIKETPVLQGTDAKNFMINMKASESSRIAPAERNRIKEGFNRIQNIAKF